ncbi:MAG: biotin-dependent carboxyltransferase family protein [Halioglobus sp.]|nr:biotin-dependent carboxyltransferase family protein [Halioglobus sp.]
MKLHVIEGGVLSLLQDSGRFGSHRLGLTNGGPLDYHAFHYCNRLLQNAPDSTVIEVSVGGLKLRADGDGFLCLTGAEMPLRIGDVECDGWTVHPVTDGDDIEIGFARAGCRAYLGVAGGFNIPACFGSTATVPREGVGGLDGGPLQAGDILEGDPVQRRRRLYLAEANRPRYHRHASVRVVPGYQVRHFDRIEQRRFFGAPYEVSERSDRMGYRLQGSPVRCRLDGILSEGICHGAVQVPPDGQPIVLLNDRQTIGGYPKIGAAIAPDTWRLAQLTPGSTVHFAPVSPGTARRVLELARRFSLDLPLRER